MNIFFVVIGILFIFNSIPTGLSLTLSNRNCTTLEPTAIDDAECKKYYICVHDDTGSLVSYDTSCPTSMVFDPSVKNCVPSMNFACKTSSIATTASTKLIGELCNGRFPVTGDTTCKYYRFCYADGATTITYPRLKCPNKLVFNSITQRCVKPCTVPTKCPPCS